MQTNFPPNEKQWPNIEEMKVSKLYNTYKISVETLGYRIQIWLMDLHILCMCISISSAYQIIKMVNLKS